MANIYRNFTQGTLKLKDGQGTPAELTLNAIKGSGFKFNVKEPRAAVNSRGTPIAWAKKRLEPVEIEFEIHFSEWSQKSTASSGATTSPRNFMRGAFTGATSVGDGGDFEFKIELTIADSGATNDENEVLTFNNCVLEESSMEEGEDVDVLMFKIKCLLEPSAARS